MDVDPLIAAGVDMLDPAGAERLTILTIILHVSLRISADGIAGREQLHCRP